MLEKKKNNNNNKNPKNKKLHLYKGWKCPTANALSQYFLPQSRKRDVG